MPEDVVRHNQPPDTRPLLLDEIGDTQAPQGHDRAGHDIEDKVITRDHHREEHGDRHDHSEGSPPDLLRVPDDAQPQQEVPTEMETRHGSVAVDEGRRLNVVVHLGEGDHGVHHLVAQRPGQQPRRRRGEQVEDDQPDSSRDEESVAQQHVPLAVEEEEPQADDTDKGEMGVNVDVVEDVGQDLAGAHEGLHLRLPEEDAEPLLQLHDLDAPRGRLRRALHHQTPRHVVEYEGHGYEEYLDQAY